MPAEQCTRASGFITRSMARCVLISSETNLQAAPEKTIMPLCSGFLHSCTKNCMLFVSCMETEHEAQRMLKADGALFRDLPGPPFDSEACYAYNEIHFTVKIFSAMAAH